jgi:hypothetical protein
MYQLYVFFMITDPKTTVRTRWGQCAVAFTVALVEAILRLDRVVHAPYYALFLVGPAANAIEIWWDTRRQARGAIATPAGQAPVSAAAPAAVAVFPAESVAAQEAPAWSSPDQPVSPL